jgi:hypothetical protein
MPEYDIIPVVVQSAYAELPEPMPGVAAVLQKPFDPNVLVRKIKEILDVQ